MWEKYEGFVYGIASVIVMMVKIIFKKFYESKSVEFCYPRSEITYEWKGRVLPPRPSNKD